jgi:hypothetical protein
VPFLFGNFQVFKKNLVKNVQFQYGMTGKFLLSLPPPIAKIFGENFLGAVFNIPKCLWKLVPPQYFDASYAAGCT